VNLEVLKELFDKISKETKLKDIGFHKIVDGRLMPVYKTQTDLLGIEKWKEVHSQNPVYIKETFILQEIVEKKQPVYINDTKNDERSADAFFLFGVDSILIVPIVIEKQVEAIVCIVSINEIHNFNEDEVIKCSNLVDKYIEQTWEDN